MSGVEAAHKALQKAQQALRTAEQRAIDEADARNARNDQRRAGFWTDAGDRCSNALQAARDARTAVVDLVAAGDLCGALDAYAGYVRAVTEARAVVLMAQDGTATYVYPATRVVAPKPAPTGNRLVDKWATEKREQYAERVSVREWQRTNPHNPPPMGYTTEFASGVPTNRTHPDPDPFTDLLAEGAKKLAATHDSAFRAELLAPLTAVLEPED